MVLTGALGKGSFNKNYTRIIDINQDCPSHLVTLPMVFKRFFLVLTTKLPSFLTEPHMCCFLQRRRQAVVQARNALGYIKTPNGG